MFKTLTFASALTLGLGAATTADAAYVPVEDWEGFSLGDEPNVSADWTRMNEDGGGRIATDPVGGDNQVLKITSGFANRGYYTSLGESALPDNAVSTLFFRLYADGAAVGARLTDLDAVTNAWYNEDRAGRGVTADRDFAGVTLDEDTWYNVWFVVDLSETAQTYDIYLSKGASAAGAPVLADLAVQLASSSSSVDNTPDALDTFFLHLGGSNNTGLSTYIGDIWVDTAGANTSNPIPEPASLALLGIGGAMMIGRRRK